MQELAISSNTEQLSSADCSHHWIIEPPEGPMSQGMCRLCSEIREFRNFLEDAPWKEDWPWAQKGDRIPIAATPTYQNELDDF